MLQAEAPRLQSLCASQQPSRCSRPDSILSDEPDAGWGVPQHGRNAADEEGGGLGAPPLPPWARVGWLAFKAADFATFDARQVPRRADAKRAWSGMYAIDAHGGFGDAFPINVTRPTAM